MICRPEIIVFQILGNTANAMGWVHIEAADRTRSKVDKTFGYVCDDDGTLRIVVHHSPFTKPFVWLLMLTIALINLLKSNL